ncbi:SRPBCC family protein [Nocardioides montaniterrae]
MAKTMHPCERVGIDYIDSAPYRYSNSVDLAITPEQLFEVLADASAWPHWAKVITHVEWTTPEPRGVGTTRDVTMRGGLVGSEEFIAWEPPTLLSFRFNQASEKSIKAFAERYDVAPTPEGCRLTWTLALDVTGPGRFFMPISGLASNAAFRMFLRKLRRYTDTRFA